jgi:branched-chain amino acid transport system substrate-binding protein
MQERGTRRPRLLILTVVLALAAVTLGTEAVSASASATSASAARQAAPNGTPLLIGWEGSQTSAAQAGKSTLTPDTLDAWTKWTNSHGGINGHPVKIVYEKDDKSDPAVALSAVKDLAENHKVLAIVGDTSGSEQAWAAYALEQKIPVIGPNNIDLLPSSNPMFYAVGGSVLANLWGQMKSAAVQGVKKVGVLLCTESPACGQARPLFKSMATLNGLDETYDAVASGTQPNYTAECLAAKQAGVQALAAFVNTVVLARDCSRQGFNPKWITADNLPGRQAIKSSPSLGHAVGAYGSFTCNGPATAKFHDFYAAIKKYHPEYKVGSSKWLQFGTGDCKAWAAGLAFAKAIENANVAADATATREDVIRGLSMFDNETLGGYAPNLTYSDGTQANPQLQCIYLYKWSGINFVRVPKDGTPTCKPES